jgi:hypothetical protein
MQPRIEEEEEDQSTIAMPPTQRQRQQRSRFKRIQDRALDGMTTASSVHPPLVYFLLGCLCLAFWALGTSCQVMTSQAWMMRETLQNISFSAFPQLVGAFSGQLKSDVMGPFFFSWGVQLALIIGSVGIELPRKPAWRFYVASGMCLALVVTNSCGDWSSSAQYGFWGQCGFSGAIFFLTFVMMLFAVMAFKKCFTQLRAMERNRR